MRALFSILILLTFTICSRADTIDFWHVYRNGKMIGDFNEFKQQGIIKINGNEVVDYDSITVAYFRDTPCFNCNTFVAIETENNKRVLLGTGKGTFDPISFSLKNLLKNAPYSRLLNVTYFETDEKYTIHLFSIKFE